MNKKLFKLSISLTFLLGACSYNDLSDNLIQEQVNTNAFNKNTWQELPSMPTARYNMQATYVDGKIYVSGGLNNDIGILDSFEVFDTVNNTWEKLPSMPSPRYIHNSVEINGKIYFIGGYAFAEDTKTILQTKNNKGALNLLQSYEIRTGKWETLKPMNTERFMPASIVYKNKIYVAGGATKGLVLNNFEVYNPSDNTWKKLANMPTPRVWGKFFQKDNYLYIVGGSEGSNSYLSSVDRYDIEKDLWETNIIPSMKVPRWGFGATFDKNGVYIAGGSNMNGFVGNVEYFNFKTNKWSYLPNIKPERSGVDIVATDTGIYLFGMDAWGTNNTLFLKR